MSRVDVARLWARRMTGLHAVIFPAAATAASSTAATPAPDGAVAAYLTGDVTLHRGPPPGISVVVKVLQGGRKHITYVAGLAGYRIDAAAFARECSKRCAASASLTTAAEAGIIPAVCAAAGAGSGGSSEGAAAVVVQVQGDEADAVTALLTEAKGYGLPRAVVHTPGEAGPGPRAGGAAGGKKKPAPKAGAAVKPGASGGGGGGKGKPRGKGSR